MGDLRLRPSTDDDLGAVLDLVQRQFLAATGRTHPLTADRLRAKRSRPGRDPGQDTVVVDQGGRPVATGAIVAMEPFSEIVLLPVVDPDLGDDAHRLCVSLLVESAERRGRHYTAGLPEDPDRVVAAECLEDDVRLSRALADLGFTAERRGLEMVIDLDARALPAPSWPDGVTVRPLEVAEDVELVARVLTESFRDHHGDLTFTSDFVGNVLHGDDMRADVSAVALDGEGPVGVILCRDRSDGGYVWTLGVLRRARRHGLGQALLARAFSAYAATGTTFVSLEVDEQSLTGATRVYERAGMRPRTVNVTWTRRIATG